MIFSIFGAIFHFRDNSSLFMDYLPVFGTKFSETVLAGCENQIGKRIRKIYTLLSRLASTSILVRFRHPSKVKNWRHKLRSNQHNLVHNKFTNTVVAIILLRSTCIHFTVQYIENSIHRVRHAYIMIINNVLYFILF